MDSFTHKNFQYYHSSIIPICMIRFYFIVLEIPFCGMSGYLFDNFFWQCMKSLIAKHVGE